MEIPAWLFITFWTLISITFLHLGFQAVEKTELSVSVPPLIMFVFMHFLAVSSSFSSSYALKFRSQSRPAVRSNYVLFVYVLFSLVLHRTIEGIFIWHVLQTIVAWLLYFVIKLKIFLGIIFWVPTFLFISIFWFLWKILPVIGVVIVAVILFYVPLSTILTIIFWLAITKFLIVIISVCFLIISLPIILFPETTLSVLLPIIYLLCICMALFWSIILLCFLIVHTHDFLLLCKKNCSELKTRSYILVVLEISLFFVSGKKSNFSPILALSISHFIYMFWWFYQCSGVVHIAMNVVATKMRVVLPMLNEQTAKKFIEFAVGTVGAVLFQNFFKITTFSEVAAFLFLAVMWLGNLVSLGFSGDFGIFNFLLANVVVGCTVGQFGLHGVTWLALGAAFLLYGLRLKLESLNMAYEEGQQIQLSFCGDVEPTAQPRRRLPV